MAKNKRRSAGEGSIYQRKDGLWVAQYKVETSSGEKTKYIYGKVRKEVAAKLAKRWEDQSAHLAPWTLSTETLDFFEHCSHRRLAPFL